MTNINFTGNSKKYFTISIALLVLSLLGALVFGVNLDIQFKGGSIVTYSYQGSLDEPAFESLAQELTAAVISTQYSTDIASGLDTVIISLPGNEGMDSDTMLQVTEGLQAAFPGNNLETMEISNVDPTMGKEFLAKCLTAVAVASLLMVVYIWLRFRRIGGLSAGAMAVVALLHDVAITFGVYIILGRFLGMSVNDNFMAVILTIVGYSLNDTIVIYDRIRENERKAVAGTPIGELVNLSINQSLKRSMITSITTIMAMVIVTVVALAYNVDSILSFSLPLIFGLACGNYSSLCVAGPLWVKWQEHKQKKATA